jgi:NAD-dependent SIR2 family protein deacetylase
MAARRRNYTDTDCRNLRIHRTAINTLKNALEKADTVIIGAGTGLSTSAGYIYTSERFQKYFADFMEKYHDQRCA